jgi:hypothetical protein
MDLLVCRVHWLISQKSISFALKIYGKIFNFMMILPHTIKYKKYTHYLGLTKTFYLGRVSIKL